MAQIIIELWVDSDGNTRVVADDSEAFDNLDGALAVRKVVLNVEVPEPAASEDHNVELGAAQADQELKITRAT